MSVLSKIFGSKKKNESNLNNNQNHGNVANSNMVLVDKETLTYISQLFEIVSELSNQLMDISTKSGEKNDVIASEASVVAANTDYESQNLQEAFSNLMNMVANIQQISQSADEVTHSTIDATNLVENGDKTIKELLTQMETIKELVSKISVIISGLVARSNQIQTITDTISAIASQTKLLALNAAIEAARAGEHGRGFAVVAEEVKKLSEQSENATGEIAELIKNIKNETEQAFEKMGKGSEEVSKGSNLVSNANDVFGKILILTSNINSRMQEVSASTEENSATSQTIVNSLNIITEKSKDNAQGSRSLCKLSEQQSAHILEIVTIAQQLSQLVCECKEKLGKVKMD